LSGYNWFPEWSPDGTWLTFSGLYRVPVSGGDHERVTSGYQHRWSPDGRAIYVYKGADNLYRVSMEDGNERRVTDLSGGRIGHLGMDGLAIDGEYLYFVWMEEIGDIWVMEVE